MARRFFRPATVLNVVAACAATAGVTAIAQQWEITRSTIDGGGAMRSASADGVFELSGTIGQPDAGDMVGGPFEMTGGFWFQTPPADCDEDGLVALADHSLFELCLTGPDLGPPPADCSCFDVDRSGTVDMLDFAALQAGFTGP